MEQPVWFPGEEVAVIPKGNNVVLEKIDPITQKVLFVAEGFLTVKDVAPGGSLYLLPKEKFPKVKPEDIPVSFDIRTSHVEKIISGPLNTFLVMTRNSIYKVIVCSNDVGSTAF